MLIFDKDSQGNLFSTIPIIALSISLATLSFTALSSTAELLTVASYFAISSL
jgi:hypothetical protein